MDPHLANERKDVELEPAHDLLVHGFAALALGRIKLMVGRSFEGCASRTNCFQDYILLFDAHVSTSGQQSARSVAAFACDRKRYRGLNA